MDVIRAWYGSIEADMLRYGPMKKSKPNEDHEAHHLEGQKIELRNRAQRRALH